MTITEEPTIQERANRSYASFARYTGQRLRIINWACAREGWENTAEELRMGILEQPLSVTLESVDPWREECEWSILLGTGGPAVRILVITDMVGTVERAEYQFQDWFTPWTTATDQNDQLIEEFASHFCFGWVKVTIDGMEYPS